MTSATPSLRLSLYGDRAILVAWETEGFSETVNNAVHNVAAQLRQSGKYIEVVPGYDSLVCVFDLAERTPKATNAISKIYSREASRMRPHRGGSSKFPSSMAAKMAQT